MNRKMIGRLVFSLIILLPVIYFTFKIAITDWASFLSNINSSSGEAPSSVNEAAGQALMQLLSSMGAALQVILIKGFTIFIAVLSFSFAIVGIGFKNSSVKGVKITGLIVLFLFVACFITCVVKLVMFAI